MSLEIDRGINIPDFTGHACAIGNSNCAVFSISKLPPPEAMSFKMLSSERRCPGIRLPPLTGREMSAMTPRRIALVGLATAGLLFFAGMLLSRQRRPGLLGRRSRPGGLCDHGCLRHWLRRPRRLGAHGGQRRSWIALAIGLGGWTAGNAVWCYVALAGTAPISNSSAAEFGYVVLPLCALGATVLVPNRNDDLFGVGLLLDGVLVAASLFLALAVWCWAGGPGEHPTDPSGRYHGDLSRARRYCVDCRADHRARPQALARRC